MNTVNFQTNTFLEKAELAQMQNFWQGESTKQFVKNLTANIGIATQDTTGCQYSLTNKILTVGDGRYINDSGEIQYIPATTISLDFVPSAQDFDGAINLWLRFFNRSYETSIISYGGGNILSSATLPTPLLRGTVYNIPTYFKLVQLSRTRTVEVPLGPTTVTDLSIICEVSSIVSSTTISFNVISGDIATITDWSNIRMVILGTKPIGIDFSNEQLAGLYSYQDSEYCVKTGILSADLVKIATGDLVIRDYVIDEMTLTIDNREFWKLNIPDQTITNVQIANKTITNAQIADQTITNAQIADAAITVDKLGQNSVTTNKLGTASVTMEKVAPRTLIYANFGPEASENLRTQNTTFVTNKPDEYNKTHYAIYPNGIRILDFTAVGAIDYGDVYFDCSLLAGMIAAPGQSVKGTIIIRSKFGANYDRSNIQFKIYDGISLLQTITVGYTANSTNIWILTVYCLGLPNGNFEYIGTASNNTLVAQ